ncbi:MAG: hypothetical protein DCC68_03155 [Planctomycetota bacterium]|nr:MAG: hypothetical protein DCC68_03155 [Planctomycetota bacterium]
MSLGRYIAVALAAGLSLGVARAWWDVGSFDSAAPLAALQFPADGEPDYWQVPLGKRAKAAFDALTFEFGELPIGRKMRYAFRVTNEGNFPLVLARRQTSCVCTLAALAEQAIPPGETAEVTLEWSAPADARPGEPYRQWADIDTNDAEQPRVTLVVEGELAADIAVRDDVLDFGTVAASQTKTRETAIVSYRSAAASQAAEQAVLAVTAWEFDDPATAKYFEVRTEPWTKEAPDEEAAERCRVAVSVKPGLPPGPFRQTIRLTTNRAGIAPLEITLLGEIGPDVYLSGPGYSPRTNVLMLGSVDPQRGAERMIDLVEFGPWSKQDVPRAVEVTPPGLVAEFHPIAAHANDGSRSRRLTVRLPPDVAASSSETQGRVVVETGHAMQGRIEFTVRWRINP